MDSNSDSMSISPQPFDHQTPPSPRKRSRSRSPIKEEPIDSNSVYSDDMFVKTPEVDNEKTQIRVGGETQDTSGYYIPQVGEVLIDNEDEMRYKIASIRGKGVFSCVVEVQNLETGQKYALKVLRNNDIMQKSGEKEIKVLQKLNNSDPNDRRHIIQSFGSFFFQGHLCLKFELMGMSLRDVLNKFGAENGLSLEAVKSFSKQGFIALFHLKSNKLMHTDSNFYLVKPDNILICSELRKIKLSDFGSTLEEGENKITENLVARYYRPPEIYLGYPYDYSLDIWSFACTIFELYTGRVLFPGTSNSHMLKLIMELKGPIPKKMRTQGKFTSKFFEDFTFVYVKNETEGPCRVPLSELKREKNLSVALEPTLKSNLSQVSSDHKVYSEHILLLSNLLEQCLELDPNERITPELALKHPFFQK